jgi:Dynamin family
MSAIPNTELEQQVARYHVWRDELLQAIEAYREWLERTGELDAQHSLRFFELCESIRQGRLTLAFVAEFSRGKSELINALFFSDFKQRLLPSDVGRTTMCPTEIFHDSNEEPYLRLLPIESRYRDESIAQLKNMPVEWVKIRLNVRSPADMKNAMQMLAQTKKIFTLEARMMGLLPDVDEGQESNNNSNEELESVDVPAWRYALMNFPHYLLTNGISIIDTPGLNALGLEPELTLNTIPNAHAVLFLLAIDTGVTKSDLEVWQRHVQRTHTRRVAVLNKIDLMWDDLKTEEEIAAGIKRQSEDTARLLGLPAENVLALSAQKALIGKIKSDQALVKKSGIERLETILAKDLIPSKQKIISRAIMAEIGTMMITSRESLKRRIQANQEAAQEIASLAGRNRNVTTKLWEKITGDKREYTAAVEEYKRKRLEFKGQRDVLIEMLNPVKIDFVLTKSRDTIEGTWTTTGLSRSMQTLFQTIHDEFNRVHSLSENMKLMMQESYDYFHQHYKFQKLSIPGLDLEALRLKLQLLMHETHVFCRDPVNIMTEKSFLIKKFYSSLVSQAQQIFGAARAECERWLKTVPLPLEMQIREHKTQLEQRLSNLAKINDNSNALQGNMVRLKAEQGELVLQKQLIEQLISKLDLSEQRASQTMTRKPADRAHEVAPQPA